MSTPQNKPRSSSAKRVAAYRQRMRDAGLVPRTIWVPDLKDPNVAGEIERACKAIANNVEQEEEIMAWIDAVTADLDLGPIPDYRLPDES
ncbi:MAG: hypothetical protein BGO82_01110 [Devosia sp. 67-54]|uniref:antitoxin MazE family protein n=1 Tax=unclassified Devosia TaxID=196773 RepID=UPI00095CBEF4|nr:MULTISPECIES: antitoxin MazE family protein [unclassified Devosia]MBN9305936.1 antitoxin MazE family protein [Devosia sp.]OJX16375.1 MAG: hypothetical protein BGO82_01110 [Devosia sp. 67-54]